MRQEHSGTSWLPCKSMPTIMTFGFGITCGKCSFSPPPVDRTTEVLHLRLVVALIGYPLLQLQFWLVLLLAEPLIGLRRSWRSICNTATITKCHCLYERLLTGYTRPGKK